MQGQHHGTTHPRMISCHSLTTGRNSSPNFFDAYKCTHIHKYSCIHTYAYIVSMHVGVIVLTISIIYNILVVCQSGWLILSVFFSRRGSIHLRESHPGEHATMPQTMSVFIHYFKAIIIYPYLSCTVCTPIYDLIMYTLYMYGKSSYL